MYLLSSDPCIYVQCCIYCVRDDVSFCDVDVLRERCYKK